MVWRLGFGVQGLGFRVLSPRFEVLGVWGWDLGFWVKGLKIRLSSWVQG